jgi:5-methylthioribose kinase
MRGWIKSDQIEADAMHEITPENAAAYLRESGRAPLGCSVLARELGWGVSNVVIRAEIEGQPPIVLKQARERLRVEAHWVSRIDRIWTERAALELLGTILPAGTVPGVLFSDEPNYLFAMTCAPDDSTVWKERLLAGEADAAVARRAGEILGRIHSATVNHAALKGQFAETEVFDQLRLDPFYRTIAKVHPGIASRMAALIVSMNDPPTRCLVLGDFSPKNILIHEHGLTLVDFETAHSGDPAFDLGFFLSHLLLKTIRAARQSDDKRAAAAPYFQLIDTFREAYSSRFLGEDPTLDRRTAAHLSACALARVDGKSPVDYLDIAEREIVRRITLAALTDGSDGWDDLGRRTEAELFA